MIETDVIIIGAGLLGCFTARNLMRYRIDVTVIEQEADVCRGISKANTGIIYAGYDNKPGSVKSKLCVQANSDFDDLCAELDVPFERPGSLMVGYGPEADAIIRKKYANGMAGGVPGLRLLSGFEAEAMEPALAKGITSALYSETTGTVDPWDLCIAAYENARDNGAEFVFSAPVIDMKRENGGFIVVTPKETYHAKTVINAAGLFSDKIREMTEEPLIRLYPRAADYIILDRPEHGQKETPSESKVDHIIFHETEDGKGLTIVPTVDGSILLGPTKRDLHDDEDPDKAMPTENEGLERLTELCKQIVPGFDLSKQIRTFGSLRPRPFYVTIRDGVAVKGDKGINDISVIEEDGLFSLIGIKTPGMTFANELGKIVADKAAERSGCDSPNENVDPFRKAIVRVRDLSLEERAELISREPAYGEIICACMDVSKAEIMQAIERGAFDFESVKRRTGAGLGKCQGSRCRRRITDLLKKDALQMGINNTKSKQ